MNSITKRLLYLWGTVVSAWPLGHSLAECDVPLPVTVKSLGIGIGNFLIKGLIFVRQNFEILKVYNGYRYWYREFFIFSGGIGTGIEKIWYRKEVPKKSIGISIENNWYRKKVSVSVSFNILGTVTHCSLDNM